MKSGDMSKIRFIPGAPPGVCASLINLRAEDHETCEGCEMAVTAADNPVWYCDRSLMSKKVRQGLAYWHYKCLVPAEPSVSIP